MVGDPASFDFLSVDRNQREQNKKKNRENPDLSRCMVPRENGRMGMGIRGVDL